MNNLDEVLSYIGFVAVVLLVSADLIMVAQHFTKADDQLCVMTQEGGN